MSAFLHEHKIFKGGFLFKRDDYEQICSRQLEDVLRLIEQYDIQEFKESAVTPTPNDNSTPVAPKVTA